MNLAATADINTRTVTTLIAGALRRRFGNSKSAAKDVADVTGSGLRTAEHWLAGRHAPDVTNFLLLLREVPELQAEVRRIIGMEANLDPEFQQAVHALITTFHRISSADRIAARAVNAAAARTSRAASLPQGRSMGGKGDDVEGDAP